METKESLQSRLSFLHLGRLFSSDRDDSSDSDDYLETGLKGLYLMLFCLGDSSSHARDQYESMETDEGGQSGPARCEFLYSES